MVMHSAVFQRKKLGGENVRYFYSVIGNTTIRVGQQDFSAHFPWPTLQLLPITYQLESSIFSKGELKRRGRRNVPSILKKIGFSLPVHSPLTFSYHLSTFTNDVVDN